MQIPKDLTSFLKSAKKPLIVILGPTASGKTDLSLNIAKKFKGEIISTDSCQIYKGVDIATAAILPEEEQDIPHHLLRFKEPDDTLSLAEYKDLAEKIIGEVFERGNVPVLVGGTGLYISAIIEGYELPRIPPDYKLREKLEKEAKEKGPEYLHKKLEKLDPVAAKSIHPNNVRYVIRALEINISGKRKKTDKKAKKSPYDLYLIGIDWPREKLYERINQRVDLQLKQGLTDEVKTLMKKIKREDAPVMKSLGIKEIVPYIKGEMTLEQCVEILKMQTRRYAKRQMTWFRRYKNVHWTA